MTQGNYNRGIVLAALEVYMFRKNVYLVNLSDLYIARQTYDRTATRRATSLHVSQR